MARLPSQGGLFGKAPDWQAEGGCGLGLLQAVRRFPQVAL